MNKRKLKREMRKEADRVLREKKSRVYPAEALKSAGAAPERRALTVRRALLIAAAVLLIAAAAIPVTAVALSRRSAGAPESAPRVSENAASATGAVSGGESVPAVNSSSDAESKTDGPSRLIPPELAALPRVTDEPLGFEVPAAYTALYTVRRAYTPDRDGQAALAALKADDGVTYQKMTHLISRYCMTPTENGMIEDTTPFIVWGVDDYRDFYYFFEIDARELGVEGSAFVPANAGTDDGYSRFIFEIWYRIAGSDEEYRGIRTEPDSHVLPFVYMPEEHPGEEPTERVVFRMPTYNEGIRDLHTNDGAPVDYEFIIVIRDRTAQPENDVLGWGEITITIDSQYEEHLAQAFEEGLLPLPQ